MSTEVNKAIVRRLFEEVFNKGNLTVADELVAQDGINYEAPPGITPDGPDGLKQAVQMLTLAFPDLHMTIEEMIAEGDKVVAHTTFSGTHQGAFMGMPPTGRRFTQQQIHIVRLADGKAVEHREVRDDVGMMQQLGVIPAPGH
ncbi:MAG TPA: ester cyclase [Ktedonobacterales bacterium]|jgi:steroid delta-isomerase-like uncharacterized protein